MPITAQVLSTPTPRGRGRPATRDISGEQIRQLILDAAAVVYASRGYHGTNVQRILDTAQVSRPTFYRYFSGRYEVLDVVISRVNSALRELVVAAVSDTQDVNLILERVVDAYFTWGDRIGAMAGPIYQEMHDPASPASAHREQTLSVLLGLFLERADAGLAIIREPLLYEAAIQVVEHLGHTTFWPTELTAAQTRSRKQVILRALRGMLLSQEYSS
ncbi:MAG: TetR/AcrR family transcriptional regulator [Pseudomonadota bacterium]